MNSNIKEWYGDWKKDLLKHRFLIIASIIIFLLANYASYLASVHVDNIDSAPVHDLVLDHIPAVNLEFIFVYGFMLVILVIIIYSLIFKAKDLHQIIFQFSLLILLRSFFIMLTHIGVPAGAIVVDDTFPIWRMSLFKNDLFFSGHTATSFLAFLLFRKDKIKFFFLAASLILAATVLFMHVHYSIDVFAAFFITYGTFHLGEWIFRKC